MDALLYYDYYGPIPRHWYECCGCAETALAQNGCRCVCHETRQNFYDFDKEEERFMASKTKLTLLDYFRSFKPYAPIPPEIMTAGELVEILEELHELRAQQCACFEKAGDNDYCPVHAPIVAQTERME